ncbi:hypothetical protein CONPUDRAFT_142660 [Coniophora puteana RWD-64-598 SS2]|uniref:Uncharacterized protein n=1 Tax=Coniophora puteana (strain RWD-64-598) TaxID=741705 RepID=A0A5M3MYW2_CONPW|nr:uncharacterized protein CONPUDRAFT_142660 [Coniophora puteana RWD-64-598 SS2]EIW84332.1 hypothetical protein CONPUDRAFT_142660 [Coniophora puteana RWD-64-598 SS2]
MNIKGYTVCSPMLGVYSTVQGGRILWTKQDVRTGTVLTSVPQARYPVYTPAQNSLFILHECHSRRFTEGVYGMLEGCNTVTLLSTTGVPLCNLHRIIALRCKPAFCCTALSALLHHSCTTLHHTALHFLHICTTLRCTAVCAEVVPFSAMWFIFPGLSFTGFQMSEQRAWISVNIKALEHLLYSHFMKPTTQNQPSQAGINQSTSSPGASSGAGAPASNVASNPLVPILDAHRRVYAYTLAYGHLEQSSSTTPPSPFNVPPPAPLPYSVPGAYPMHLLHPHYPLPLPPVPSAYQGFSPYQFPLAYPTHLTTQPTSIPSIYPFPPQGYTTNYAPTLPPTSTNTIHPLFNPLVKQVPTTSPSALKPEPKEAAASSAAKTSVGRAASAPPSSHHGHYSGKLSLRDTAWSRKPVLQKAQQNKNSVKVVQNNSKPSDIKTSKLEHRTKTVPTQPALSITKAYRLAHKDDSDTDTSNSSDGMNSTGYQTIVFESADDWDYKPNGAFEAEVSKKFHKQTRGLMVHWATSTYGVPSGPPQAKRWDKGQCSKRSCQGIITCENDSCNVVVRPQTRKSGIRVQISRPCHRCGASLVHEPCENVAEIWTWSGGYHYRNGIHGHNHSCPRPLHASVKEEAQFIDICENHPAAGPAKLIAGIATLSGDRRSVADISPAYVNIDRVTKDRQKLKASVPRGGDTFIFDFSHFDRSHPNFVTSTQVGNVTVLTMQSKFMKTLLLKDHITDEPVNGFVTDATHKYFADHNALLLITATYSLELTRWVPVQFAYLNGATAAHYRQHFLALFKSIALQAIERKIPVTDDLFAGVVDFSDAERIGFEEAFVDFWNLHRQIDDCTEDQLRDAAKRCLKGCHQHFIAGTTRLKRTGIIHSDRNSKSYFDMCIREMMNTHDHHQFQTMVSQLRERFPKAKSWLDWWLRPEHAALIFESQRKMKPPIWEAIPFSTNASEAMHAQIYRAISNNFALMEGLNGLYALHQYFFRLYVAALAGTPIKYEPGIPWKQRTEEIGRSKSGRRPTVHLRNNGPPFKKSELLKHESKQTDRENIGCPWTKLSCWLDTALELLFWTAMRDFDDYRQHFNHCLTTADFYKLFSIVDLRYMVITDDPSALGGDTSKLLGEQRDMFRAFLKTVGIISSLDAEGSVFAWLSRLVTDSRFFTGDSDDFLAHSYFQTLKICIRTCNGIPLKKTQHKPTHPHMQISSQPQTHFGLSLFSQDHTTYGGSVQRWFQAITRTYTPHDQIGSGCWREASGAKYCHGQGEVTTVILSLPVMLIIDVFDDPTHNRPLSWDVPKKLQMPVPKGEDTSTHGLFYELVGLALYSPTDQHFIARYSASPLGGLKESIYTYDGMHYGGQRQRVEPVRGQSILAGANPILPPGYSPNALVYRLHGGLMAQQEFYAQRLKDIQQVYSIAASPDSFGAHPYLVVCKEGFKQLDSSKRLWTQKTSLVDYEEEAQQDLALAPALLESDNSGAPQTLASNTNIVQTQVVADALAPPEPDPEFPLYLSSSFVSDVNLTIPISELPVATGQPQAVPSTSECPTAPDWVAARPSDNEPAAEHLAEPKDSDTQMNLDHDKDKGSTSSAMSDFLIKCQCGLQGDGYAVDHDDDFVQCDECGNYSHVACQRDGRASGASSCKKFVCDDCDFWVLKKRTERPAPSRKSNRHLKRRPKDFKDLPTTPLAKRLKPGIGALARHGKYYYPVRLLRRVYSGDGTVAWKVKWWRRCLFSTRCSPPQYELPIPEQDVVDALWHDWKTRRMIRLGQFVHAAEEEDCKNIVSSFEDYPCPPDIASILLPHVERLCQLWMSPDSVNPDDFPVMEYVRSYRKPKNNFGQYNIPHTGDLTTLEQAQIANWFYCHVTQSSKESIHVLSWLECAPLAHAYTIVVAHKKRQQFHSSPSFNTSLPEKEQVRLIFRMAWTDLSLYSSQLDPTDVDRECLGQLEDRMFQKTYDAGLAGNDQWGLDAGSHQHGWNPYAGVRNVLEDEDEEGSETECQDATEKDSQERNLRPTGSNHRNAGEATEKHSHERNLGPTGSIHQNAGVWAGAPNVLSQYVRLSVSRTSEAISLIRWCTRFHNTGAPGYRLILAIWVPNMQLPSTGAHRKVLVHRNLFREMCELRSTLEKIHGPALPVEGQRTQFCRGEAFHRARNSYHISSTLE